MKPKTFICPVCQEAVPKYKAAFLPGRGKMCEECKQELLQQEDVEAEEEHEASKYE